MKTTTTTATKKNITKKSTKATKTVKTADSYANKNLDVKFITAKGYQCYDMTSHKDRMAVYSGDKKIAQLYIRNTSYKLEIAVKLNDTATYLENSGVYSYKRLTKADVLSLLSKAKTELAKKAPAKKAADTKKSAPSKASKPATKKSAPAKKSSKPAITVKTSAEVQAEMLANQKAAAERAKAIAEAKAAAPVNESAKSAK